MTPGLLSTTAVAQHHVRRGLYGPPPPGPQPESARHPTLLFSWFCTLSALAIVIARVWGRLVRNSRLFAEDKVMLLSIVPLVSRMAFIHVVLLWGTNNVDLSVGLSDADVYRRSIGSRLVLGARIFYALYIWIAKFTVSEFLKRLTSSYWKHGYQVWLHLIRVFLLASFIAVVISTLSDCRPLPKYWQVTPDPGPRCRQSYGQLFTMAVADIITDALLIIFPLAILASATMPALRKAKLATLFSINAVLVTITSIRVYSVVSHAGAQQRRTVYASGEILAAAAVSNAVILGSFLRDRGVKRERWHGDGDHPHQPLPDMSSAKTTPNGWAAANGAGEAGGGPGAGLDSRRQTLTRMLSAGPSEEDLFRDMCYRSTFAEPTPTPPPGDAEAVADDVDGGSGGGGVAQMAAAALAALSRQRSRPAPPVSHDDLRRHDSRSMLPPPPPSRAAAAAAVAAAAVAAAASTEIPEPAPAAAPARPGGRRPSLVQKISGGAGGRPRKLSAGATSADDEAVAAAEARLARSVAFADPGGLLASAEASTESSASSRPESMIGVIEAGPSRARDEDDRLERPRPVARELRDVGGLLNDV